VSLYRFIDSWKAMYGTGRLCRVLVVPESSYFDWHGHGRQLAAERADAEALLVTKIRDSHVASDGTYGSPRVHADLVDAGVVVSARRVAGLMAAQRIVGLSGREHSTVTTRRDRIEAPFPDLVERHFRPAGLDVVWYGDITYIWVGSRFWYLATVVDAASKKVIGWRFADHMRAGLAVDALHAAVARRGGQVPAGLIFHSDPAHQRSDNEDAATSSPTPPHEPETQHRSSTIYPLNFPFPDSGIRGELHRTQLRVQGVRDVSRHHIGWLGSAR